jgi:hypothetical protein
VDAFAEDPRLAILPVHVVAEQQLVQVPHVVVVREHDVPGVVEREAVRLDRATPAAHALGLLDQQRVLAQVICRAQAGRPGSHHDDRRRRG